MVCPEKTTFQSTEQSKRDEHTAPGETDLASLIYHLRKRLEPNPRTPRFIETVRGLGYRLVTRPFIRS